MQCNTFSNKECLELINYCYKWIQTFTFSVFLRNWIIVTISYKEQKNWVWATFHNSLQPVINVYLQIVWMNPFWTWYFVFSVMRGLTKIWLRCEVAVALNFFPSVSFGLYCDVPEVTYWYCLDCKRVSLPPLCCTRWGLISLLAWACRCFAAAWELALTQRRRAEREEKMRDSVMHWVRGMPNYNHLWWYNHSSVKPHSRLIYPLSFTTVQPALAVSLIWVKLAIWL